jgi:hypothetical protein
VAAGISPHRDWGVGRQACGFKLEGGPYPVQGDPGRDQASAEPMSRAPVKSGVTIAQAWRSARVMSRNSFWLPFRKV